MRPPATRRSVIGIIAVAWITLLPGEQAMSLTATTAAISPAPHCVGRFDLLLPPDLHPGGREASLYLVRVWSEALPASGDPTETWARHTASLRQPQGSTQPPRLQRDLTVPGVGPAALYRAVTAPPPGATAENKLLAMKPSSGHVVFLESTVLPGRESVAVEVISQIARSYAPGAPDGFCVSDGAFVIPPSKNERARAAFAGDGGISVSVATETVAAPVPAPSPEDTANDAAAVAADGGHLAILAQRERTAANLPGHELRVAVSDKATVQRGGDPELIYTWTFPGEPADGRRPHVSVKASAPAARRTELDAAWEMLLSSLRQRASPR